MTEEKRAEALSRLKMLLGIEDSNSDELLSFVIDDMVDMVLGYCRIAVLPRQLESLVPVIAADMWREKGYGSAAAPEIVKSISEGERSVSYADTAPDDSFFENYYDRLKPFVNRRGRLPSEV